MEDKYSHDEYAWMENLSDERVLRMIEEENARFRRFVDKLSSELFPEVWELYSMGIPTLVQPTERGVLCMVREGRRQVIRWLNGDVVVDSSELGDTVLLQWFTADESGRRLAYSFSEGGSDEGITRIIDTETGEVLDEIKPSVWNVEFTENGFYMARFYRRGKTPDGMDAPAERVFLKDEKGERMVFGEGLSSGYFMELRKSSDGKSAMMTVSLGWNSSKVYVGPFERPEEWREVYSSESPASPVDVVDSRLYVLTKEGRGTGRVISIDLEDGSTEDVIPETDFPIDWAVVAGNRLIVGRLVHASHVVEVHSLSGEKIRNLSFSPPGTVVPSRPLGDSVLLRYESFTVPYRIYELTAGDEVELRLIDGKEIEGRYRVGEEFATSKDGTPIHYFTVKGQGKDRKKAWVFGYGGFNIALTPRFFPQAIPFIRRGGTFVMANLRGGSEYGEEWHRAGMRENKQNVFDDFIAVLEKLKGEGYKVAAWGRSNGGLLVSATLVQRPDVMDAALIGYPVIDMLRFHRLYIGSVWVPEYGDPDDPKDREFLLRYSPYHNVKPASYPPTLIYTGLHDDRVHPAHALKFFMKLREVGAPVYLRVETSSGHMGASPEIRVRELSDLLAFVMRTLI
ncbi:MAG: S9 family peptidase [Thermococci archaeon]|nr:S9 family peptidase [Thermococci archaeon]